MTANDQGLSVSQMSAVTGVGPHTLRYYERAGLLHAIARNASKHRRYSASDVEWVRFLLKLRATGMPVAQMREYAVLRAAGEHTAAARLQLLSEHRSALSARIADLLTHERALDAKITHYREVVAGNREENTDPPGSAQHQSAQHQSAQHQSAQHQSAQHQSN